VTEYIENITGKFYNTPINVNATYLIGEIGNDSVNLTENMQVDLQFSEIFSCNEIASPGSYVVGSNLSSNGTCFNVTSENVTIDSLIQTKISEVETCLEFSMNDFQNVIKRRDRLILTKSFEGYNRCI